MTVDVRARLAEGAEAVADQLPPIHDWYYAEAGVRLEALAADAAALASASAASEEALLCQRAALEVMTEGWRGGSGYGAVEFLSRHCSASTELVAALRDAAAILTTLGANLEHAVGVKVNAALCGDWSGGDPYAGRGGGGLRRGDHRPGCSSVASFRDPVSAAAARRRGLSTRQRARTATDAAISATVGLERATRSAGDGTAEPGRIVGGTDHNARPGAGVVLRCGTARRSAGRTDGCPGTGPGP